MGVGCSWKLDFLGRVMLVPGRRDAEGAELWVSHIHSRREPPVLAYLILKESGPTFASSKVVLLRHTQQVMTVKSRNLSSCDPTFVGEGFCEHKAAVPSSRSKTSKAPQTPAAVLRVSWGINGAKIQDSSPGRRCP